MRKISGHQKEKKDQRTVVKEVHHVRGIRVMSVTMPYYHTKSYKYTAEVYPTDTRFLSYLFFHTKNFLQHTAYHTQNTPSPRMRQLETPPHCTPVPIK